MLDAEEQSVAARMRAVIFVSVDINDGRADDASLDSADACALAVHADAMFADWSSKSMRSVFWLSDEAWSGIEPLLPSNQPGARRVDDRRVISGIIHVLQSGCRWRDCPVEYGPYTTVYNRFNRWSRRKIWQRAVGFDVGAVERHGATDAALLGQIW